MIHVVAIIIAKPGQRGAILEAFHANVATVHAEHGCIEYVPVIDLPDGGTIQTPIGEDGLMVIEKWESVEALRAHAAAPHMVAYSAKIRDLVASRAIHVLSPA